MSGIHRALLAALAVAAIALHGSLALAADVNETARQLAGLQAMPGGAELSATVEWYPRRVSEQWSRYERNIAAPMRAWGAAELAHVPGETVFYPFSGPDFPTVQQLYPQAGRYVLVAIQRATAPPALERYSARDIAALAGGLQMGWDRLARGGYFHTVELDRLATQAGARVSVTAPLMAFAARLGYDVLAVEPVRVNGEGSDLEPSPGAWDSVRLVLAKDGRKVLLDYVRVDLSDGALHKDPAQRAWVERMARHRTVLKAASHLPQNAYFSIIRDAILARAPSVVQDETGIDYAKLAGALDVTLYGRFTRPHTLFNQTRQLSLSEAYQRRTDVKPLSFRYGYEKGSGSAVQVAVRRGAVASAPRP